MSIKYIKPFVRDEALTYEAFLEHWHDSYSFLTDLRGLKQYRMVLPTKPERSEFDGIAELHFETLEALRIELGIDDRKELADKSTTGGTDLRNEEAVSPMKNTPAIIGEEIVEKDDVGGETDGLYKHSAFLNRKEGMSHEEFFDYWANEHAPIAREVPGVVRYVRVIPPAPERAEFDGVAELYFRRLDALHAVLGHGSSRDYDPDDPKASALREDAENLHSIDRPRFIGTELVRINRL